MPAELYPLKDQIAHIATDLGAVSQELREISHGLHPAVLSMGLASALKALRRSSAVPVTLDIDIDARVPERIEVAAYYVVAEALTNVAKHARASKVDVRVDTGGATLRLLIRDEGDGGADAAKRVGTHRADRPRGGSRRYDGDLEPDRRGNLARRQDPLRGGLRVERVTGTK